MAGRSFTRQRNGPGHRVRAEHINELQVALEEDDARIDQKTNHGEVAGIVAEAIAEDDTVVQAAKAAARDAVAALINMDGGAPGSVYGGTVAFDGGTP